MNAMGWMLIILIKKQKKNRILDLTESFTTFPRENHSESKLNLAIAATFI